MVWSEVLQSKGWCHKCILGSLDRFLWESDVSFDDPSESIVRTYLWVRRVPGRYREQTGELGWPEEWLRGSWGYQREMLWEVLLATAKSLIFNTSKTGSHWRIWVDTWHNLIYPVAVLRIVCKRVWGEVKIP